MEAENEKQNIVTNIKRDSVLFFDLDGTLVNTNLANFLSYKKAIHSVTKSDHDLTYNSDKRFNRSNLKETVPNLNSTEYERIIQEKEKYYNDFLHETKINRTVAEILSKYSKSNRTVLVTNCREDRAIITLNYYGLTDKFSDFFFRQLNTNGKNNKFQYPIQNLNIPPKLIIVFEDEKSEIEDALKVGITNYYEVKL